jgi:chromosome segregation ATPase
MSRAPANNFKDVEAIVRQLLENQQQVTPYRVQKELGRGSYAWVKKCLAKLEMLPGAGLPAGTDPDVAEVIRLTQPLVDRLNERARKDMDKAIEGHEKEIEVYESQLERAEAEKIRLNSLIRAEKDRADRAAEDLEQAHKSAQRDAEKAETRLAKAEEATRTEAEKHEKTRESLAKVQAKNADLAAQLSEAKTEARTTQANLEHFRASSAEQAQETRNSHAAELGQLNKRLQGLEKDLSDKNNKLGQLNRENAELVAERSTLNKEVLALQASLKEAERDATAAHERERHALDRCTRLEAQIELRNQDIEKLREAASKDNKQRGKPK